MKNITTIIILTSTILFASISYAQNTIEPKDLNKIIGKWKGSLTYIDYGSNKPFTMPTNLLIENGKNKYQFKLLLEYPNESNANSTEKIKISKNGTTLNRNDIISVSKISNEEIKIITEYLGKDNNLKAQIRMIYIIGNTKLVIRKEVKFENIEDWTLRNEYNFSR